MTSEVAEPAAVAPARILLVDDEVAQMRALCDTLRDRGYDVTGYTSPVEAVALLTTRRFDLILTDLQMPGMDGIALMRRAFELDPDVVFIMMTGHGTVDAAVEAMRLGAFDFIQKPFKLGVMIPAVERALSVRALRMENAALVRHLRERGAELEVANRELEAFSYSVAHDLRAPLRAVNGFSTMLIEDYGPTLPGEARELLERVQSGATRMGQLIEDLLRLSRVVRQPISLQPVCMNDLVAEVLRELQEVRAGRNIQMALPSLPDAMGDPSLLRQVYFNFLSNAIKFTRDRDPAVIEVGFERQGEEGVYFVRDNGAGFDMKHAERLFGVFQRLHSVEDFDGTGVGLSIVQRIVNRLGGRVWAEAQLNQGATFRFTLPRVES